MPTRSDYLKQIDLVEDTATLPAWGGVSIRELDAEQRIEAITRQEAARNEGVYNILTASTLWSYVIVCGLLDEPGGRPIFNESDLPVLMKKRPVLLSLLGERIWGLSEATPEATKSGGAAPDSGQLDTEGSTTVA